MSERPLARYLTRSVTSEPSEGERVNLRDLEKAATAGPWSYEEGRVSAQSPIGKWVIAAAYFAEQDGDFIAQFRNAAPFLLDVEECGVILLHLLDNHPNASVSEVLDTSVVTFFRDAVAALDSHLSAARRNPK